MARIAALAEADPAAVEALLDAAFGTDRHGRTAYRMRAGVDAVPALSFAAFGADGALVGTLQSWPLELATDGGPAVPLLLVGPVAVRPDRQRGGIGRALMQAAVDAIDAGRHPPAVLIGDPEYYGRFFGFSAEPTAGWAVPGPVERRRLLARAGTGAALPAEGTLQPRRAAQPARFAG